MLDSPLLDPAPVFPFFKLAALSILTTPNNVWNVCNHPAPSVTVLRFSTAVWDWKIVRRDSMPSARSLILSEETLERASEKAALRGMLGGVLGGRYLIMSGLMRVVIRPRWMRSRNDVTAIALL